MAIPNMPTILLRERLLTEPRFAHARLTEINNSFTNIHPTSQCMTTSYPNHAALTTSPMATQLNSTEPSTFPMQTSPAYPRRQSQRFSHAVIDSAKVVIAKCDLRPHFSTQR
jgi:hypothetical protein